MPGHDDTYNSHDGIQNIPSAYEQIKVDKKINFFLPVFILSLSSSPSPLSPLLLSLCF
jgi:hypothetical protein